ncbi:MAG: hypothetical protein ABSE77_07800 [Acidimicrobiales bacterium]
MTWHADTRTVVLSHWTGALCTASTRVALADMSRLIVFLVNALDRSARAVPTELPGPARPGPSRPGPAARAARDRVATALTSWRRLFGPRLAQVVSIGQRRQAPGPETTATAPCSPPAPLARDRSTPVRSYPD